MRFKTNRQLLINQFTFKIISFNIHIYQHPPNNHRLNIDLNLANTTRKLLNIHLANI